jgi:hypothetical protein
MICQIADGYHLNAHDATTAPTQLRLTGTEVESIQYPPGELTGNFEVKITLKSPPKKNFELALSYQACNDTACLPIATKRFAAEPH